ncbi:LPS export ABC transporter permease LptG [Alphaproteobacteria bacterium]|nr:LPS export ABC transporter permease LptG [Alphaproteobacteria bacterium]
MSFKSIYIYIAKKFIKQFIQIVLAFALLIFLINFIEIFNRSSSSYSSFYTQVELSVLSIPQLINEISTSIILISAIICYFNLAIKNEITIIRISGLSIWHISQPIALSAFGLGIFWISIFQPISTISTNKIQKIESEIIKKNPEIYNSQNQKGIWLRQENLDHKGQEIIINSHSANKNDLTFLNNTIWFFDEYGVFYKKINSKTMTLKENRFILEGATINSIIPQLNYEKNQKNFKQLSKESLNFINQKNQQIIIPSNIDEDFIRKKIINNLENASSFTIFQLPNLIKEMENSGLNSQKFKVRFNYLITLPLMFLAMSLIACFFGINHVRNHRAVIIIFLGILAGVALYIISAIITSFGSSGLISVFASTWMPSFICIATAILLIYSKEKN